MAAWRHFVNLVRFAIFGAYTLIHGIHKRVLAKFHLLFYEVVISHELKNNRGLLLGAILDMLNLQTVADSNSLHLLGTALRLNVQFFTFFITNYIDFMHTYNNSK